MPQNGVNYTQKENEQKKRNPADSSNTIVSIKSLLYLQNSPPVKVLERRVAAAELVIVLNRYHAWLHVAGSACSILLPSR